MGTSFSDSQAQLAKFWYEKVPYTYLNNSLQVGKTVPMVINNLASTTKNSKMAILSDLGVTQSSNVYLTTQSNSKTPMTATTGYPSNLAPVFTDRDSGLRSTNALSLYFLNNTGASVANVQLNYSVGVKNLTVADKVMLNLPLTSPEQHLQQKFEIGNQGLRPLSLSRSLEQTWLSRVVSEEVYAYEQTATTYPTALETTTPGAGEILVLTSIAIGGVPIGNQVTLTITRDQDNNYVQVLGDNANINTPFDCWVPARRNIIANISAVTTTADVTIRLTVLRLSISSVLLSMFGLVNPSTLSKSELNLYEQVLAGVVV